MEDRAVDEKIRYYGPLDKGACIVRCTFCCFGRDRVTFKVIFQLNNYDQAFTAYIADREKR